MARGPEPKYPKIWFGDGCQGAVIRSTRRIDEEGIEWYHFWIRPTQTMMDYWGIRDTELDEDGAIPNRPYKKTDVILLGDDDPSVTTFFIMCSYKWHDTNMTLAKNMRGIEIQRLQKLVKTYRDAHTVLESDYRKLLTKKMEWAREANDFRKEVAGKDTTEMPDFFPGGTEQ